MKSKILILIAFVFTMVGFSGCEKESTSGYTRTTAYPSLEVFGESLIVINAGTTFVDPGYKAEMAGEDVTDQVVVTTNLDANNGGVYTINYKITNSDGFGVNGSRKVIVVDMTASALTSGLYNVATGTVRTRTDGGADVPYSVGTIGIYQVDPGVFFVTDLFGGYYSNYLGRSSAYNMEGYIQLNGDNTFTLLTNSVAAWGDSLDGLSPTTFDPVTGGITWTASYAGFLNFNVILTK